MIISHKYKFVFIKTQKTAGTSIEVFLSALCGQDDILTPINPVEGGHRARNFRGPFNPVREILAHNRRGIRKTMSEFLKMEPYYNHIAANIVKERLGPKLWDSYFTFCFERNPWDKTLSHYHMHRHKRGGNLSLEEYLDEGNFCLNYPLYVDGQSLSRVIVDHVGLYENLDEELAGIFARLDVPFPGTLRAGAKADFRTDRRSYKDVLTADQRDLISDVFRKEIELHGYEF